MSDAIIGFLGVIIGVVITIGKDIFMGWYDARRKTAIIAVNLVCALERFIAGCVDVVKDNGYQQPTADEAVPQVELPMFDWSDGDIDDLKSIPLNTMYQVKSLPNSIEKAKKLINSSFENDSPPSYSYAFENRQHLFCFLGLEALGIVEELRSCFGITSENFYEKDYKKLLQDKFIEITRKI